MNKAAQTGEPYVVTGRTHHPWGSVPPIYNLMGHNMLRRRSKVTPPRSLTIAAGSLLLLAGQIAMVSPAVQAATPTTAAAAVTSAGSVPGGGSFVTLPNSRVLDTRGGQGGYTTDQPGSLVWRSYPVAGVAGIPTTGVSAVAVTITAVAATSTGWLQLAPNTDRPTVQTTHLSYELGDNASATAMIEIGTDGRIAVRSTQALDIVVDVQGYFTTSDAAASGGAFRAVSNFRLADSRVTQPNTKLTSGQVVDYQLGGINGVPQGTVAAFVTISTVSPDTKGWLTAYPTGSAPGANSLNFAAVYATSIGTTVKLDSQGRFSVKVAGGPTHIVIDVQGYFDSNQDGGFNPAVGRVFASASGTSVQGQAAISVQISDVAGVPAASDSLAGVVLSVQALKVAGTTSGGHFRIWPTDEAEPETSALNYGTDDNSTTTVIVRPGQDNQIYFHNMGVDSTTVALVVDVQGYFLDSNLPDALPPEDADESLSDFNPYDANPPSDAVTETSTTSPPCYYEETDEGRIETCSRPLGVLEITPSMEAAATAAGANLPPESQGPAVADSIGAGSDKTDILSSTTAANQSLLVTGPMPAWCRDGNTFGRWEARTRIESCNSYWTERTAKLFTTDRVIGKAKFKVMLFTRGSISGGSFTTTMQIFFQSGTDKYSGAMDFRTDYKCRFGCRTHNVNVAGPKIRVLPGRANNTGAFFRSSVNPRPLAADRSQPIRMEYGLQTYIVSNVYLDTPNYRIEKAHTTMRCDNITWSGKIGCVTTQFTPTVVFSKTGVGGDAAKHVERALNSGMTGRLVRITRQSSIDQNRRAACPTNRVALPWSCDEYPFASSSKGAASDPFNGRTFANCHPGSRPLPENKAGAAWSACGVDPPSNSSQGGSLGAMFKYSHVISGDRFNVRIVA